jgi:hypothetical protein
MTQLNGTVVNQWLDSESACVAVAIDEGEAGLIEYNACVPRSELDGKAEDEQRAILIEAINAERAKQFPPAPERQSPPVAQLPPTLEL